MYFADSITVEGRRTFISADFKTGKFRIEPVSDAEYARFIRDVLALESDQATNETEKSA